MSKRPLLLLLPLLMLIMHSCENEVDLLDDYREIPVIYGLVDPSSTTHYVRVQKAFLGQGNALVMAQESDSLYYDTADVRLYIDRVYQGLAFGSRRLFPVSSFKEEGLFTDQGHYIFRLDNFTISPGNSSITSDTTYRIRFENTKTGLTVTGSTKVIRPLQFQFFNSSVKVNLANENPYPIRFFSPKNGKIFGLVMRIKYDVVDTLTQTTTTNWVDYTLDDLVSLNSLGGETMTFLLPGETIFKFIGSRVNKPVGSKKIYSSSFRADYLFTVGTEDLYNYIRINAPGNTVFFIPEFTNLSAGKGLFSCRMNATVPNIRFNDDTEAALITSPYTRHIFQ